MNPSLRNPITLAVAATILLFLIGSTFTVVPETRQAVVLRFYLDLPDGEIAELIGCRPATVRTLIHRALRDLRRAMMP